MLETDKIFIVRVVESEGEQRDDATYPHIRLNNRDKMYTPAGVRHQYLNFTNDTVKAFVAVTPMLQGGCKAV